jgi:hypothetical protein
MGDEPLADGQGCRAQHPVVVVGAWLGPGSQPEPACPPGAVHHGVVGLHVPEVLGRLQEGHLVLEPPAARRVRVLRARVGG